MTVGERIKALRKEKGISVDKLAELIGKDRATIYRYESKDIENMPTSVLEPLAIALGTTPGYIMGWSDRTEQKPLPSNLIPLKKIRHVPLLGRIACGEPILAEQNYEGKVMLPEDVNADFALKCQGDSMIDANIQDGDIVFIQESPTVENGEIAAVVIGDEATLKKVYYQNDTVTLLPANSAYEPYVYKKEEINNIRICGKAVAILRHIQ